MEMKNRDGLVKFLCLGSLVVTLLVNILSVALPLNGRTPGEISDSYPNLFAPAGITFSIWSVIYLSLILFTIFQFGILNKKKTMDARVLQRCRWGFIVSNVANAAWIFSWHFGLIPLSVLLMVIILGCLIVINLSLQNESLSLMEMVAVRIPFGLYFGWITVATIANITVLFVTLGWHGSGVPSFWTVLVMLVGAVIACLTILRNRNIPYALVLIWAYLGIFIKHVSPDGFAGAYPTVPFFAVIFCVAFAASAVVTLRKKGGTPVLE